MFDKSSEVSWQLSQPNDDIVEAHEAGMASEVRAVLEQDSTEISAFVPNVMSARLAEWSNQTFPYLLSGRLTEVSWVFLQLRKAKPNEIGFSTVGNSNVVSGVLQQSRLSIFLFSDRLSQVICVSRQ